MSDETQNHNGVGGPNGLDEKTRHIRRGDLIISPLMVAGSIWFAYDSFELSRMAITSGKATISTSPGLMPFLVSVLIAVCSMKVFLNALASGADFAFLRWRDVRPHLARFDNWTAPIVMGLFVFYVFVLIGHLPFLVATIVYGVAMMAVFKATKWIWIITINVGYAAFVIYCFTQYAFTDFPMPWPF